MLVGGVVAVKVGSGVAVGGVVAVKVGGGVGVAGMLRGVDVETGTVGNAVGAAGCVGMLQP